MKHAFLTALLAMLLMTSLRADPSLDHARQAQALLGSDVWSRVIRVENFSKRSLYPATVYALVFEFNGMLWFYTDINGTQSFSRYRDHLKEDKNDFYPMLREIDPGFRNHTVLDQVMVEKPRFSLPNGCFIESLGMARELALDSTEAVLKAALLSMYVGVGDRMLGHTVLAYETKDGVYIRDPAFPEVRKWIGAAFPSQVINLAKAVVSNAQKVSMAKLIPVTLSQALSPVAGLAAAAPALGGL